MIEKPGSDASKTAMRSAFTISTGSNRLHLLTYDGKVGYGVDGSNAGISKNEISLGNVAVGTWNSVAFVYNEPNGGNGSLTVTSMVKRLAKSPTSASNSANPKTLPLQWPATSAPITC